MLPLLSQFSALTVLTRSFHEQTRPRDRSGVRFLAQAQKASNGRDPILLLLQPALPLEPRLLVVVATIFQPKKEFTEGSFPPEIRETDFA